MIQCGLLVDLDRCVGCYACEVACQKWNNLTEDVKCLKVRTIGPEKINGELRMNFYLEISSKCNFCESQIKENKDPICVSSCPTQAIKFCTYKNILDLLRDSKRYQICRLDSKESIETDT